MGEYGPDPLARLLVDKLKFDPWRGGLTALALGLFYLLLPAAFGNLRATVPGYLGSLDDWHSQILLLLVVPAVVSFYLWQPKVLAKIALRPLSGWGWRLALAAAVGGVLFDTPEMLAIFGRWWAAANPLMIAIREVWLGTNVYMLGVIALRHFAFSGFGLLRAKLANPHSDIRSIEKADSYSLAAALLWGILGVRLSIEVIELPARAGGIPPDFYLKVFLYVLLALSIFLAPLPKPPSISAIAKFALITLLPLPVLLLFWVVGLTPQFAF